MTKKLLMTIIAVLIAVVLATCFVACSTPENTVKIENGVISRFGDGISVLNSYLAPDEAVEYTDEQRVKARINVDARMSGYHMTGIYLPAGETLTVNVSNEVSQLGYGLSIDSLSKNRKYLQIDSTEKKVFSEKGGIVEIFVPKTNNQNSFDVIIEGGIVMPYYRLGRDDVGNIYKGKGKYTVLDAENIRFYVPADVMYDKDGLCVVDDLYNTLMWWQSAVNFMNEATGSDDLIRDSLVRVAFGDYNKAPYFDYDTSTIRVDVDYINSALDFENLKVGSSWDLLYQISNLKIKTSSGFDGVFDIEMIVDILCSIDYVMMTNSSYNAVSSKSWLNNSYTCLEKTIELISLPEIERNENYDRDILRAFFINIMHSFGVDKTLEIIIEYSHSTKENREVVNNNPEMTIDDLAIIMSDILKKDMSFYFEYFGMNLSEDAIDKMKGKQLYIPVQSKYTVGGSQDVHDIGFTLPMGEKAYFDFNGSIISLIDGWSVAKINGESNLWSEEEGKFYYNPSTKKLQDSYELLLRNGEYSTTLYGRINVNIATATYKVYEGWTFSNMSTALDDAIDKYEDRTPDYSGSIEFAGIKEYGEEDEDNTYVLTVAEGCMSVPESGDYRIYLKNNGLCKVQFGVQKYMFDMFRNSLPVAEYTDYLSYDIHLDDDKIYEFRIFMLSTKGDGSAVMGIKHKDSEDNKIYNIDENYLIYKGLEREDIVDYVPPQIYPENYEYKDEFYQHFDIDEKNFVSYPEAVVTSGLHQAFDSLNTSYYVAYDKTSEYEFVIDLGKEKRTEYFSFIAKDGMEGAKVTVYTANKNESKKYKESKLQQKDFTLKKGENIITYSPSKSRYVKIVISKEENFECSFTDFSIGQHFEKSQIVANTSSSLAYMGGWTDMPGYVSVNGSISQSVDKNSIMSFTAICRQVCFYGVKDSNYGKMDVYVDGSLFTTVDLYSSTPITDTLLFAIDFDIVKEHSIKIMPASKDDIINVDYISYIPEKEEELVNNTNSLYLVLIIPAVISIALAGAAIADKIKKDKSKKY